MVTVLNGNRTCRIKKNYQISTTMAQKAGVTKQSNEVTSNEKTFRGVKNSQIFKKYVESIKIIFFSTDI